MTTLLKQIDEEEQAFGDSIYQSCSDEEVSFFSAWVSQHFSIEENKLRDYIDFSRVANALNYNGLFVYGISKENEYSIFAMNEVWWDVETQKRYLFYADDSISWYCLDVSSGVFYVLDKPSGEKMEQYQTFDELLCCALEAAL
jgi:hypothetical protein